MEQSILKTVKKVVNVPIDYNAFDLDIIMAINSAFSTLHQLGLGPVEGFRIEDDTATWDSFTLGDMRLNSVQDYVRLKVRLAFDPPANGFTTDMMKEQIKELEWRLNVVREGVVYGPVDPTPEYEIIYDGGTP